MLQISPEKLMDALAELRFGASAERLTRLRRELEAFAEERRFPVSRTAIRGWFRNDVRPARAKALAFLRNYLEAIRADTNPGSDELFDAIAGFFERSEAANPR